MSGRGNGRSGGKGNPASSDHAGGGGGSGQQQRGGGGKGGGGGGGGIRQSAALEEALKRREADRQREVEAAAAAAAQADAVAAEAKRAESERLKLEAAAAAEAATVRAAHLAARQRFEEEQALWAVRLKLREANLPVTKACAGGAHGGHGGGTGWEPSARMDSSIKKCSGYLKKLKLLNEHPQESLLKELEGITLHKYVEEVVSSLLEFKFTKSIDMFKALHIASVMHHRH